MKTKDASFSLDMFRLNPLPSVTNPISVAEEPNSGDSTKQLLGQKTDEGLSQSNKNVPLSEQLELR